MDNVQRTRTFRLARTAHVGVACVLAASVLVGCSGGGSSGTTPASMPSGTAQSPGATAISIADALGSAVGSYSAYDESSEQNVAGARTGGGAPIQIGQCEDRVAFYVPDRHGDPNSTEALWYYDAACTQVARDVVRIYAPTGPSSENVSRVASLYAPGNGTPTAVRTTTVSYENATFGRLGYPVTAAGFDAYDTSELAIAGATTAQSAHEIVMLATSDSTASFCGDSAGFNVAGLTAAREVYGYQGGVSSGGTRTQNADGSQTWSATRTGSVDAAAPGALAIVTGTQNAACPIATPMFTLSGGSDVGAFSIPATATFDLGFLRSLSIANATLPGGAALNVATNAGQPFTSQTFITGTIVQAGTTIASFGVDAFGDGALTVTSTGQRYAIVDWQVVR